MLELAAKRAKGIDLSEPPLVRQLGLMDWYIAYELQVRLLPNQSLAVARNELHSQIQDVFNKLTCRSCPEFCYAARGQRDGCQRELVYRASQTPSGRNVTVRFFRGKAKCHSF